MKYFPRAANIPARSSCPINWPAIRKHTPTGDNLRIFLKTSLRKANLTVKSRQRNKINNTYQITHPVITIIASDRLTKTLRRGFPFSPSFPNVTPNTAEKTTNPKMLVPSLTSSLIFQVFLSVRFPIASFIKF